MAVFLNLKWIGSKCGCSGAPGNITNAKLLGNSWVGSAQRNPTSPTQYRRAIVSGVPDPMRGQHAWCQVTPFGLTRPTPPLPFRL